jgi:hypothetical protein
LLKEIDKELELSPETWQVFLLLTIVPQWKEDYSGFYLFSHFGLPGFLFVVGTGSDWDAPDWWVEEFILESSGWLAGFSRSDNPSKLRIPSRRKGPAFRSSAFNNKPACPKHLVPLISWARIWMSNKVTTMMLLYNNRGEINNLS